MSRNHKYRLLWLSLGLVAAALIIYLVLFALRQNIDLFFTVSELIEQRPPMVVRVGGIVKPATLILRDDLMVDFILTDETNNLAVHYQGLLPDLFREQQMVVVRGQLYADVFYADQILAKHDQNYRPPSTKPQDQN